MRKTALKALINMVFNLFKPMFQGKEFKANRLPVDTAF